MRLPLTTQDIGIWVGMNLLILLSTYELTRRRRMQINRERLRLFSLVASIFFALIVAMRILEIIPG